MQIVEIENRSRTEFHAAELIGRCARAGVVPRADDKEMFRSRLRRSVCQVIAIIAQCAQFVTVVLACDCQDRQCDLLELLARGHHRIVVSVWRRMFQGALEIDGWISNE